MSRTCLIFTIQLCPADFLMIQDILADIQTRQRKLQVVIKKDQPINFLTLEPIINDLKELILQSRTNDFKFNGYILKLIILKIEKILYDIQLSSDSLMLETYIELNYHRTSLIYILDDLINPF